MMLGAMVECPTRGSSAKGSAIVDPSPASLLGMRVLMSLLLAAPLLSGCLGADATTVALLLADGSSDMRTVDVEAFTQRVEATCEECEVVVHDAEGDVEEQQAQVAEVVAEEPEVVVIWPVEPEQAEGYDFGEAPVVSLVTLVPGSDRFVGMAEPLDPEVADQGSELEAARDVVAGRRRTMVHVPARDIGEQAADVAVGQLAGNPVPDGEEHEGVRSWLFEATEVNLVNLTTVLVGEGVLSLEELCEGETARRCSELGLR